MQRYRACGKQGGMLTVCSYEWVKRMMQVWRLVEVLGPISACRSWVALVAIVVSGRQLIVV